MTLQQRLEIVNTARMIVMYGSSKRALTNDELQVVLSALEIERDAIEEEAAAKDRMAEALAGPSFNYSRGPRVPDEESPV